MGKKHGSASAVHVWWSENLTAADTRLLRTLRISGELAAETERRFLCAICKGDGCPACRDNRGQTSP